MISPNACLGALAAYAPTGLPSLVRETSSHAGSMGNHSGLPFLLPPKTKAGPRTALGKPASPVFTGLGLAIGLVSGGGGAW